jgi:hypothetical protein
MIHTCIITCRRAPILGVALVNERARVPRGRRLADGAGGGAGRWDVARCERDCGRALRMIPRITRLMDTLGRKLEGASYAYTISYHR